MCELREYRDAFKGALHQAPLHKMEQEARRHGRFAVVQGHAVAVLIPVRVHECECTSRIEHEALCPATRSDIGTWELAHDMRELHRVLRY